MRVIAQELQELRSVVAAALDPVGVLLEANAGFMHLLGTSPARRIGANVALLFAQPVFAELGAVKAAEGGLVFRGSLKVIDATGRTLELPGQVWRTAYGFSILAEYDIEALRVSEHKREAAGGAPREVRVMEASLTDKLTGTGNRERLDEALATEISRVRRTGLPLSAFMCGIDRFEEIDGRHGREGASKVLVRLGYLLKLLTRPTDIATRFQGDEFVVVLPHTNLQQSAVVVRRIQGALAANLIEPLTEPATASFGVAQFQAGEEAGSFLKRLQSMLGKARDSGGTAGL